MSSFKVGDKVRVAKIDKHWGTLAANSVGHEGVVTRENSEGDFKIDPPYLDKYGPLTIFGPEELELIEA